MGYVRNTAISLSAAATAAIPFYLSLSGSELGWGMGLAAVAAGGLSTLSGALTGSLGNAVYDRVKQRPFDPEELLRNHDLHRLTGSAIRILLEQVATEAIYDEPLLRELAVALEQEWSELARDNIFQAEVRSLTKAQLQTWFHAVADADTGSAKPAQALDATFWKNLLKAVGAKHDVLPEESSLQTAAKRLTEELPLTVRELLKRDFSGDTQAQGAAFAGYSIKMFSEILAAVRQNADNAAPERGTIARELSEHNPHFKRFGQVFCDLGEELLKRHPQTIDEALKTKFQEQSSLWDKLFAKLDQIENQVQTSHQETRSRMDAQHQQTTSQLQDLRDRISPDEPPPTAQPITSNLLRMTTCFTGRRTVLKQVRRQLKAKKHSAIGQVIGGLGGIGKTQTAIKYAHEYQQHYEVRWWINADTEASLLSDVTRLLQQQGVPHDPSDPALIALALQSWMETREQWLLIFDNADQPELLKPYLCDNPRGHLLITTRRDSLAGLGFPDPVRLEKLSPTESSRFLKNRAGKKGKRFSATEQDALSELVELFDGLPLALEQAGAYIRTRKTTFEAYLTEYRRAPIARLEASREETFDAGKSVATTWLMNFKAVAEELPAAAELLKCLAFLAPNQIPRQLLSAGGVHLGEAIATSLAAGTLDDLLYPLTRYSLIENDGNTISVHRMVQEVTRHALNEDARHTFTCRVVKALGCVFPPPAEMEEWKTCELFLPHVINVARFVEQYDQQSTAAGELIGQAGRYSFERGRFGIAEPLCRQAREIMRTVLGNEHPKFAISLNNLAWVYHATGRYDKAESNYLLALHISRKTLGEQHMCVASGLNNLAGLYESIGRYESAERLYLPALEITRKLLGEKHPKFATNLNNLSALYYSTGQYKEAERLGQQALEIRREALGEEHPVFATSLDNSASLYQARGQYEDAERLYQQAFMIRQKAVGEEHPAFAVSLNNLAWHYNTTGCYKKAEPLFQQALQVWRKTLGEDHPEFATGLNNLAWLYHSTCSYEKAEPLYRQALEIRRKALGEEHPEFANSLNNLASLHQAAGRYADAEPHVLHALEIQRKSLGEQHPAFANSLNNLASLYQATGRFKDAKPHLLQALEIQRKAVGEDHPEFATILNNLGSLYQATGRCKDAERLYQQAIDVLTSSLGPDHPNTQGCITNLQMLHKVRKNQ